MEEKQNMLLCEKNNPEAYIFNHEDVILLKMLYTSGVSNPWSQCRFVGHETGVGHKLQQNILIITIIL